MQMRWIVKHCYFLLGIFNDALIVKFTAMLQFELLDSDFYRATLC